MKEEPFVLENYLTISAHSPEYQKQLEQVYREMGQTPEGREVIERAYELNDRKRLSIEGPLNGNTEALVDEGKVVLPENDIMRKTYYGSGNTVHDTSLNRAAFHETFHVSDEEHRALLADPDAMSRVKSDLLMGAMMHAASEIKGEPVFNPMQADVILQEKFKAGGEHMVNAKMAEYVIAFMPQEKRTVEATNAFMQKYYGEEPRQLQAATTIEGSPELEVHTMQADAPSTVTP